MYTYSRDQAVRPGERHSRGLRSPELWWTGEYLVLASVRDATARAWVGWIRGRPDNEDAQRHTLVEQSMEGAS